VSSERVELLYLAGFVFALMLFLGILKQVAKARAAAARRAHQRLLTKSERDDRSAARPRP
jgi:hypothetical protein